jgi:Flp pilus assembly protein TadB
MVSMIEVAAAMVAGAAIAVAVLAGFAPVHVDDVPGGRWVRRRWARLWEQEEVLVATAGWPGLDLAGFVYAQVAAAAAGALLGVMATGLVALAVPAAVGAGALVRLAVMRRAHATRVRRQDAVLEAVRMLRQLLETGAANVQQAIAVLAERGPEPLRNEFRLVAATTLGRRQAWNTARDRIAEPLFDMLAAAVLIQGPGGGELAPLFADLEATVSSAQEVEREADALQVQARSAAAIIVSLPVAFLLVLSALRSPYLDAFRQPAGEAFLLAMLGVMAASYAWMRRLLRLQGLQRVRLVDA